MNVAAREIAKLDQAIKVKGDKVRLMKFAGAATPTFTADIGAWIRPYGAHELTDTIKQGDFLVIISPTGLDAAGWPGGGATAPTDTLTADPRIPKANSDKVMFDGRARTIEAVLSKWVDSTLVRLDCQVRG